MKKEAKAISSRAQTTIFIIIAIVLLAGVLISFFVLRKGSSFDSQFSSDPEIQAKFASVKTSIGDCMKETCNDALVDIGSQGGYYKKTGDYYDFGFFFMPYYYKEGKINMPSNQIIQEQLGLYVDDILKNCLNGIVSEDFKLTVSDIKTNALISEGEVSFKINGEVAVEKNNKVVKLELKDDPITISSKLYDMIAIARYISVDSRNENTDAVNSFCLSCIINKSEEKDLLVNVTRLNDNTNIFIISDNKNVTDNYVYMFLESYKGGNEIESPKSMPEAKL